MGFGALLIVLSGVLYGMSTAGNPVTAFIPSVFGIGLIILGIVALRGDKARKHAMHVAAMLGLIGCVVPLVMAIPEALAGTMTLPVVGQLIMGGLCGVFLALCVKSFIDARKARKAREEAS